MEPMRSFVPRMGLALVIVLAGACGRGDSTAGEGEAARIMARALRAHVEALAHDSMRGRATPSPELEEAARYVAARFRAYGLRPGAEGGSYLQRYPIAPNGEAPAPVPSSGPEGAQGFNAIGWLEGSDPRLREEAVVLVAHMDGLGTRRPVAGDSIQNGADGGR